MQHVVPCRIAIRRKRGHERHAVLLRLGDGIRRGHARREALFQRLLLRVGEYGHQAHIACDGIALGELAQARGARGEERGALGQPDAGNGGMVQRFDLARLKNALHHNSPSSNPLWRVCAIVFK
jgi:hypothetical protein